MKKKFTLFILLLSITAFSQRKLDQYSIEADYGLSAGFNPSASGSAHFGVGFRYMLDESWGIKFDYAQDKFRTGTPETGTDYTRYSVQGVHNLGRTLNMRDIANGSLNLLAHGGLGYSSLKSTEREGVDKIGNVIIGLSPQVKLINNLALQLDISYIINFTQHYNFDGTRANKGSAESITGTMLTFSAGLTFYFGKNGSDSDWR